MTIVQKIRVWIQNHKLISGFIVAFLSIIFIFLPQKKQPVPKTSQSIQEIQPPPTKPIALPIVSPQSGTIQVGGTQNGITLIFTMSIDLDTVKVSSNPPLEFNITTHKSTPKQVIIAPQTPWKSGETYTITIERGVRPMVQDVYTQSGFFELMEDIDLEYVIEEALLPEYPPGANI